MIYSSVEDNWMRVEIMHSVAKKYYETACDAKLCTNNPINSQILIDLRKYKFEQQESCIVGMIMVWCIVTLESLANHALAHCLNNKNDAIKAIEYPNKIDEFKFENAKSELSKKLVILNEGTYNIRELIDVADKLSETRNSIVHDKPYKMNEISNGAFEVEDYRIRKRREIGQNFINLKAFYEECDLINNFLVQKVSVQLVFCTEINFSKLFNS